MQSFQLMGPLYSSIMIHNLNPESKNHNIISWEETRMLKQIDLNSDVGESFGAYKIGLDEAVVPLISSANIACGFHAGDPLVMAQTISLAVKSGVGLGAHPGLPDLMGFGRRVMDVNLEEIRHYLTYQVGALQAFAKQMGLKLQHVKPHGALYNMAVQDTEISNTIAEVISGLDENLILVALAGPNVDELTAIAKRHSIRVAFEFFADRAYNADGSLVSRKLPGAVLHDDKAVAERVTKLADHGTVTAIDGSEIELKADTICVHGDNPKALALVKHIRISLTDSGITVRPMGVFL
jgi:5-oxoprolinase (ATP-hydrolysing) subunit A